jgi:hypothetical protein
MNTQLCIICVTIILIIAYMLFTSSKKEHYRDPLYLNRAKLAYDWYPRANGSIYGMPWRYGGSWSIVSGYPLYNAY